MAKARRAHLNDRELSALLRVPETTIRYWRHMRTLPVVKIGRRAFTPREAALEVLKRAGSTIGDHNLDETLDAHAAALPIVAKAA
jgi:hypothetical protein